MMKNRKIAALMLALVLVLGLCACGTLGGTPGDDPGQSSPPPVQTPSESVSPPVEETPSAQPSEQPGEQPSGEPTEEPTQTPDDGTVRLAVLSGPTGVGAAKLLSDADAGLSLNTYDYTIASDNSELVAGLAGTQPAFDIATVASNVALNLYNKTNGGVKIIALGTRGVLHILEGSGGTMVESVADLEGETIYSVGQGANPEYILRYLLAENGLDPDEDVTIVFAEPSEIQARLLSGEIKYAMLPVPAATAAIIKGGGQVRSAVDVTEAWEKLGNGSQLIMTAVVARTEFIEKNPEAVANFLKEYKASIEYVNENQDAAAELIAGYGITPNATIAKQAIPQCHLVYIDGRKMAPAISDYFMVLYSVNPAAVGGKLPDDAIYYVP